MSGLSVDHTLVVSIRLTVRCRRLPSATMCVAPGTASTPSYGVLSSMNQPHAAAKLQPRVSRCGGYTGEEQAATGRLLHTQPSASRNWKSRPTPMESVNSSSRSSAGSSTAMVNGGANSRKLAGVRRTA